MSYLGDLKPRQKQLLKVGGALVVILILSLGVSFLMDKRGAKKPVKASKVKVTVLKEKIDKDAWMAAESSNVRAIEKTNEEMKKQIEELRKEMEITRKAQEEEKKDKMAEEKEKSKAPASVLKVPLPSSMKGDKPKVGPPEEFPPKDKPSALALPENKKATKFDPAKGHVPVEGTIRAFSDESRKEARRQKPGDEVYVPSGSFMKAVLLNGIDAPTSGSAQAEPYPVLMSIQDLSILPNRHRVDLVECFIVGAGYGNLSDERAYIRTEGLSCVRKDGKVIDISLKGHVIGEDGKLGMRGRIVSKQGQQIAYSLLAGVLSSFAQAFRPDQNISVNITDQARTSGTLSLGDSLLGVGQSGVGLAFNEVAKFYLKMAEKVYPVIEIDAGRNVEVIMLKGQSLKLAKQ